jgi:hypothetical protein
MRFCVFLILLPAFAQGPAEVRGTVVDARGGEALSNVVIQLAGGDYRATTDSAGRFRIAPVEPGEYVLNVSTVGYHLAKRPFRIQAAEAVEFEVVLTADTLRQTDTVQVRADPFEGTRQDSANALVLAGNDAKNLGSVLVDDPLRAVQSLPGVSANNDFEARFSLRGADFNRIGLYLDGILLHQPFHTLRDQNVQGSATAFNADMVEQMELHEGAWPQRFENRTAGVLDVRTRDGSRTPAFRFTASVSNAGGMAEGPLGKKGAWLAGARKSYLQYIFSRLPDSSFIFGFEDAQGRLSYELSPRHHVSLYVLESYSTLDRENRSSLGVNSLAGAGYHYTLGNAGWRYASSRLMVSTRAAWMREKFDNFNPGHLSLGAGYYGEWVANSTATWTWSSQSSLDAGVSLRRLRDSGFWRRYLTTGAVQRLLDNYDGAGILGGGFAQQSWSGAAGRVRLSAGVRWDRHSVDEITAVSPQASAAVMLTGGTRLNFAWGQYAQYPELSILTSILGRRSLPPMRSIHAVASLEQRLGPRTRVRVGWYNRADRDLPFQSLYDPRIVAGKVIVPPANPLYASALRGYSRGFEAFVQRSSANRFTGWVSYAYGRTGTRDAVTGSRFPADLDQRHTINVYGGYRLKPTVNLSARWSAGSGFPIPGYFAKTGANYYLSDQRNRLRLASYGRVDVRINKSWTRDKWKLTLYGEVVNLANRTNYFYDSLNGYNSQTRQAFLTLDTMFPILPSAGIQFAR